MNDCIFCSIINKEIPAEVVYENNDILAFWDVNPAAPVHILIIPKEHIPSANHITATNLKFVTSIFEAIPQIANQLGIAKDGYRIINNCGHHGGQTVNHLHFHLLGGTELPANIV